MRDISETTFASRLGMRLSFNFPLWELILLLTLFTVNLFLKIYGISGETIYGDEAYSISVSSYSLGHIIDNFKADQNPPFYFILLHWWIGLTGVSDISLKMLSVIFSMLCCISIYFFAKRNFGIQAAIFSLLLFTFSNGQEFFARECRGFALTQLLVILSYAAYCGLIERPRYWKAAVLTIINLLLLFTHYITVFIPILQAVFIFFKFRKNKKAFYLFLGSQVLALLMFLPWIRFVAANMPKQGIYWISTPDWNTIKITALEIFGSSLLRDVFTWFLVAALLIFILDLFVKKIFKAMDPWKFMLLFAWAVVPFFADYFISKIFPVFFYRYLLYTTLGLYLFAGYFFSCLNLHSTVRIAGFAILLYFQVSTYNFLPYKGDDWKELVPKIARIQNDSTAILVSASYKLKEFSFYYDQDAFLDEVHLKYRMRARNVFTFDDNLVDWSVIDTNRFTKIVLVQSHQNWYDPENKILNRLSGAGYRKVFEYQRVEGNWMSAKVDFLTNSTSPWFKGSDIWHYTPDQGSCETWQRNLEITKPYLDTLYHCYNGFEAPDSCDAYHTFTQSESFKGSGAVYADKDQPYGYAFVDSLDNFLKRRILFGNAFVKCNDSANAAIIIVVEKEGKELEHIEFACKPEGAPGTWSRVNFYADLRKVKSGALLKVFIFNMNSRVYMDEMNIYLINRFF